MPFWQTVFHDYVTLPEPQYLDVFSLWVQFCDTFDSEHANMSRADLQSLWEGYSGLRPLAANANNDTDATSLLEARDAFARSLRILGASLCTCACLLTLVTVGAVVWRLRHALASFRSHRVRP